MEKYKWQEVLGRGSFGVVSLVHETSADGTITPRVAKEVSLKFLSPKVRHNTRSEVNVLRSLKHVNIIAYHESFIDDDMLYIVMEYADAGDLGEAIKWQRSAGQRLGPEPALSTLLQCARALRHIHARNIVHRDVKAQNVFLTTTGGVKLGDFGVARVLEHTGAMALTGVGTPTHLAPEVCDGFPYSTKADVWSFGVVMYEVLSLELPFLAENILALVAIIATAVPKRVAPEPYHQDVWSLVFKMLQKDAADRPCADTILASPCLSQAADCDGPGGQPGAFQPGVPTASSSVSTTASLTGLPLMDHRDSLDGLLGTAADVTGLPDFHSETLTAEDILQAVHIEEVTPPPVKATSRRREPPPPLLELDLEQVDLNVDPRDVLDQLLENGPGVECRPRVDSEVRKFPMQPPTSVNSERCRRAASHGAACRRATSSATVPSVPVGKQPDLVRQLCDRATCLNSARQITPRQRKCDDLWALNVRGAALGVLPRPRRQSEEESMMVAKPSDGASGLPPTPSALKALQPAQLGHALSKPAPPLSIGEKYDVQSCGVVSEYPRLLGRRRPSKERPASPMAVVPTVGRKLNKLPSRKSTV